MHKNTQKVVIYADEVSQTEPKPKQITNSRGEKKLYRSNRRQ